MKLLWGVGKEFVVGAFAALRAGALMLRRVSLSATANSAVSDVTSLSPNSYCPRGGYLGDRMGGEMSNWLDST